MQLSKLQSVCTLSSQLRVLIERRDTLVNIKSDEYHKILLVSRHPSKSIDLSVSESQLLTLVDQLIQDIKPEIEELKSKLEDLSVEVDVLSEDEPDDIPF